MKLRKMCFILGALGCLSAGSALADTMLASSTVSVDAAVQDPASLSLSWTPSLISLTRSSAVGSEIGTLLINTTAAATQQSYFLIKDAAANNKSGLITFANGDKVFGAKLYVGGSVLPVDSNGNSKLSTIARDQPVILKTAVALTSLPAGKYSGVIQVESYVI